MPNISYEPLEQSAGTLPDVIPYFDGLQRPPGLMNLFGWWVLGAALIALIWFVGKRRNTSSLWKKASDIAGYTLYIVISVLLLLESYFHLLFDQTDLGGATLSSRAWVYRHWTPLNEQGYRDFSFSDERFANKKLIAVLGDSFAAGYGIRNVGQRFSGVLQSALAKDWEVATIASVDWDNSQEWEEFRKFRWKPDVLVLSVYYNDVENTVAEMGAENLGIENEPPQDFPPIPWLCNHSYAASYIFWRYWILSTLETASPAYCRHLHAVGQSSEIWNRYVQTLAPFVEFSRNAGAKLIVVVFPMLSAPHCTAEFDKRVRNYFLEAGAQVVYVADLMPQIPQEELMVNRMDMHPGPALHRKVGEALAGLIAP